MMDSKTCKFDGCGLMYKNLYELIHHIEEDHIAEIEKKKLQELDELKQPKPVESPNGVENEGDSNPSNAINVPQERAQTQFSQSIPLSLLCKLKPFPKGHKVFPIAPKKVTMNFCQYRKRPSMNEPSSNELISPLHNQKMYSNQFGGGSTNSSIPFGSFQAPNAKRPARRISEIVPESGFQKDVKPSISATSILPVDERRYRCDVEGCKKAYKNTQGLRAHIRNTHNLAGGSPKLSPSEESILSRQLPNTNLVSPLTTGISSQPVAETDGRTEENGKQVVVENEGHPAKTTNIQQCQIIQPMSPLGSQRIQQHQQRIYNTSKYPCQHCPKTYKTLINLNKHMQESHPKQVANTTVGQLISPIRSHSPRMLSGQSQILSSPNAMSTTPSSGHASGLSPKPMSPSTGQPQQHNLVSAGRQHAQSPVHGSAVTLVPASPQHISHAQPSNYGHGVQKQQTNQQQQQQYYVTTNAGQVLHQQSHPARSYSYQQENQYTGNSSGQQIQLTSYSSSSTSSPVQGTTIYVSQQQKSPIQLQQYTVSGAPSQQQVYSSSTDQSTTIIEANRIIVGRTGGQPPSAYQQPRGGSQQGQPAIIHHRVPYTSSGQRLGRQQQYQQRLLTTAGQQPQQSSSNATTIRVSSLNPYHHSEDHQQQYVQVQQQQSSNAAVTGAPVYQQQMSNMMQAAVVSQPSYMSQQQIPSSHTPSSFVVRTSNHSYVKQSFSGNIQQPIQRYNPPGAPSDHQQQLQLSSSSFVSANQSRGNNSSSSIQHNTQSPGTYTSPLHYNRAIGGQQVVLRSVSPSSSTNTSAAGAPQVRMLAASGHNYAQSPNQQNQYNTNTQYQSVHYAGPKARTPSSRGVSNSSNVVQPGEPYSTNQQVVGRTYDQGCKNYYSSSAVSAAQGHRTSNTTYPNPINSNEPSAEPTIAPTLQPQEPVQESYSTSVSAASASNSN